MSVSARVPAFYRYAFTWFDPAVSIWAAWLGFADQQQIVDQFIPNTPRNPDLDMFFHQTSGYGLGLAFLQIALLRSTDDLKTWKMLQYATLIVDFAMLYSLHWTLSRQGRLAIGSWRGEEWASIVLTVGVTLYRLAFVSELGFRGAGRAKKGL